MISGRPRQGLFRGGTFNAGVVNNGSNQVTTATSVYGLRSAVSNGSTNGAITNAYGVYASATNSGTVTNGYGLYVTGFATGGTHTNTPYDIYAADAGTYNYFAGNVGVGTLSPQYPLSVNGTVQAKEVLVNTGWSDYVFAPGYRLAPLSEAAAYVQAHHHLPEIPSAAEVQEKGISLGEMQAKLLAKIEELTLHMIAADEKISKLEEQNRELQERVAEKVGK